MTEKETVLTQAQQQKEYCIKILGLVDFEGSEILIDKNPTEYLFMSDDERAGRSAHFAVTVTSEDEKILDKNVAKVRGIVVGIHQGHISWDHSKREVRSKGLPVGISKETRFSFGVPPEEEE